MSIIGFTIVLAQDNVTDNVAKSVITRLIRRAR